jgi:hypothetical protein
MDPSPSVAPLHGISAAAAGFIICTIGGGRLSAILLPSMLLCLRTAKKKDASEDSGLVASAGFYIRFSFSFLLEWLVA